MGKNNKARRAAKARTKARSKSRAGSNDGRRWSAGWSPPPDDEPLIRPAERARFLLWQAAKAQRGDRDGVGQFGHECRTLLEDVPAKVLDRETERFLLECTEAAWDGGWQPAELHRQGRLGCATAAAARLVALAIAVDHAGRRSSTLDSRWSEQVDSLDLPLVNGRLGWVARWVDGEGLERTVAIDAMVDVVANIGWLPRLDVILPPPGSSGSTTSPRWTTSAGATGGESDAMLARVRNLLAKAESTTFEAEAMALTAKAQELMTRHAIDAAMVQGGTGSDADRPIAIRVPIDAPYVDAKSLLLQTVAEAGRCRSVLHSGLAMSTVMGFPDDVHAVELLFTSLLVQAQTALTDAAKHAPAGTRTRSQSYRSAFLLGYTDRIDHRLREINDAVYAEVEAERGGSFLPVLRSRADEVDDVMAERFGDTVRSPVRGGHDAAGWAGGTIAADNAQLTFGDIAEEAARAS